MMKTNQRRSCGKEPHTMRKHTIAPERRSIRSKRKLAAAMSAAGLTISMLTLNFPAAAPSQQCDASKAVLARLYDTYPTGTARNSDPTTETPLELRASTKDTTP